MIPPPNAFLAASASFGLTFFLSTSSLPSFPLAMKTKDIGLVFACFRESASLASTPAIGLSPKGPRMREKSRGNVKIMLSSRQRKKSSKKKRERGNADRFQVLFFSGLWDAR